MEVHLDFDDPDVSVRVADDGGDPVLAHVSAPLTPEGADTIPEGRAPTRVAGTRGGHGVTGMAERAPAFGGTLGGGPRSGGGWEVRTTLPRLQSLDLTMRVRVVLADDQALLRRGFRMILEAEGVSRSWARRAAAPTPLPLAGSTRRTSC